MDRVIVLTFEPNRNLIKDSDGQNYVNDQTLIDYLRSLKDDHRDVSLKCDIHLGTADTIVDGIIDCAVLSSHLRQLEVTVREIDAKLLYRLCLAIRLNNGIRSVSLLNLTKTMPSLGLLSKINSELKAAQERIPDFAFITKALNQSMTASVTSVMTTNIKMMSPFHKMFGMEQAREFGSRHNSIYLIGTRTHHELYLGNVSGFYCMLSMSDDEIKEAERREAENFIFERIRNGQANDMREFLSFGKFDLKFIIRFCGNFRNLKKIMVWS